MKRTRNIRDGYSGCGPRRLSAANYLETAIVIDGSCSPIAGRRLDDLLRDAETFREPLLSKGDDFVHTGIADTT
jgi:uncharacterized protein with PIN domain